ncbi:hypothetical protein [Pedobacter frigoris]|uniref:hypothetical protein n=1 Tax=Pedobacter frigoris TaxID=2571272 RepID=UPI0029304A5B|nr:hypothetical protein [Pedobacter frigoris]
MSLDAAPFTKALNNLRIYEELTLYGNLLDISDADERQARQFLGSEYKDESQSYPYDIPDFDSDAALWGARVVYVAAQLLLFRQHKSENLKDLISDFSQAPTPAMMLSADLCMRFLPDILHQLKYIDPEDVLIDLLEGILRKWHYSAVAYPLDCNNMSFENLDQDQCFLQLYLNRIVEYKNLSLAHHVFFASRVAANLGIYASELWNDFKNPEPSDEQYK